MIDLRLDIDALVGRVAHGEAVWAMVLRQPPRRADLLRFDPLRLGWLARWRRRSRRQAGLHPQRVSLRVAAGRVELLLQDEPIASLPFLQTSQQEDAR